METPFTSGAFKPDAAFANAAQRFFELLQGFGMPSADVAGGRPPGPCSAQAPPASPGFARGFGAAPAFGPLPLGAGAAPQQDAQRTWDLVARLAQLQGQLAGHWSEIASSAARRFIARLGTAAG